MPSSLSWSATGSSSGRSSSVYQKQHRTATLAGVARGSPLRSSTHSSSWGVESSGWDEHSAGGSRLSSTSCVDATIQGQHMYAQPILDVQCSSGNASAGGDRPALALASICTPRNLDPFGLLASSKRASEADVAGGDGGIAGSEALRLLVDLLLRQGGGRCYALAQLDELDGSQAAMALQLEVLNFIASAFGVPDSYPLLVPQLAEFHVHYHLLHFTRHYYKLPYAAGQTVAACSKGHIKVLLALCRHTGGANLIRRRFLQLRVLDFLMRELSLEHALLAKRHGQGSSSCATTPASTARSSVTSSVGVLTATGEGWTAAAHSDGVALRGEAEAAGGVLTERGLTGLLSSSLSSLSITRETEQEQQFSGVTHAPVAEEGTITAAANRTRQRGEPCSALSGGRTGSPPQQQQQQHVPPPAAEVPAAARPGAVEDAYSSQQTGGAAAAACSPHASAGNSMISSNAGSKVQLAVSAFAGNAQGSPARLGSVQSRVQKIEAAAAAARTTAAAAVKPQQQRRPGGCVVAVKIGANSAAACRVRPLRMPRPPIEPGPGVAVGLRFRSAASCLAVEGCGLSSSSSGGGGENCSFFIMESAEAGTAAPSSSRNHTDELQAINRLDFDCGRSEDLGSRSDSLSPGSPSPAHHAVAWKRLDSSSTERDTSMRLRSGVSGPPTVPRLAFGAPAVQAPAAAPAAAAAATSDDGDEDGSGSCSYRPGFDLEEDFERMMDAEEAGSQAGWELSSVNNYQQADEHIMESAEAGTAAPSSSRDLTDELHASNELDFDCGRSEDLGSRSDSLSPGSPSPAQHAVAWKRLDSSSIATDTRMRLRSGVPGPPAVPRLAFGAPAVPAPAAAPAAAAAATSDDGDEDGSGNCDYRPGFDLEEDFERMMDAEEAGSQAGCWELSSENEDSGSECSSLIAAGRDVFEEPEQQVPPRAASRCCRRCALLDRR
ncbi:hypothetical protein COO60DRAFT_721474 [Scenedesmus sp. NREL 46B-D3]|nr:hypothetical protein COO60DRAFT_721474 [Scenedesmus sp. NREL 46B-D3]